MSDFDKRLGKICVLDSMDPVLRCFLYIPTTRKDQDTHLVFS